MGSQQLLIVWFPFWPHDSSLAILTVAYRFPSRRQFKLPPPTPAIAYPIRASTRRLNLTNSNTVPLHPKPSAAHRSMFLEDVHPHATNIDHHIPHVNRNYHSPPPSPNSLPPIPIPLLHTTDVG